ncbi:glycosyltransferase family 9 protein [Pseudodesulfovibrio sp. JC047]|uniref:glycosyltransferase family 9 protein n=1 Tax=Pseudodesulfovibrio sp. JC047 TaxID=2683199 RepID=UPI0013D3F0C9|nr:glycosyltransferase family 9 protein [Pseudodesulfovibrio sp. JC047]NDV20755.1 glycosyltransferase family 9 protein [Pseudodesulfovibrio sp. JC047]
MTGKKPILILQMQRMGDLILSYPLMLWLARRYPDHPILVAAEASFFTPLMKLSPAVTYIPWSEAHRLKRHSFKLVLNLSIQEKAAILAGEVTSEQVLGPVQAADGSRFVHGDWQLYRASLVTNNRFNRYHWAELNALDCIPYADIHATQFDTPRTVPDNRTVGLFLGASDTAKRPSAPFWAALVDELHGRDLRPVLFGGPAEKPLGRQVASLAAGQTLDLCGTLGLDELSAVGQTIALFITPDTGPMHLAVWSGVKCLNLSMGNVNAWETGPYSPGHTILRADMDCAKGCWACSRDKLSCHDAFKPGPVAAFAARMIAGDGPTKLARMKLPGLAAFETGTSDLGLFHLTRLDQTPPDAERLLSRFWQRFFGAHFGLWETTRCTEAWNDLTQHAEKETTILLGHLPEMGRQFKHGLRHGSILDDTFWVESPTPIKPLTGYAHLFLENTDYSRSGWSMALTLLEKLIALCQ